MESEERTEKEKRDDQGVVQSDIVVGVSTFPANALVARDPTAIVGG
jgi:hypothetical protein